VISADLVKSTMPLPVSSVSICSSQEGILLPIAVHFEHQKLLPVYTEAIALPY